MSRFIIPKRERKPNKKQGERQGKMQYTRYKAKTRDDVKSSIQWSRRQNSDQQ